MNQDLELVIQFDKDSSGWLNAQERQEARKYVEKEGRRSPRGPGGPFGGRGFGREAMTPQPGIKVTPTEVKSYSDAPLYASNVLRTVFLDFESEDWEDELEAFYRTDVEVTARLTVDNKSYPDVGVRFRGNTSYMMAGDGGKRPLNISMDMAHKGQALMGHRTLNLLNSAEDPSSLRTVLALQMAREYMPAPRANFVRLVINGESWGVYSNVEQFNKDFLRDNFGVKKGVRWKVPVAFGGSGGLTDLGNDVALYRRSYELKSDNAPKAWASLMNLCRVLNQTPINELEAKLPAVLDVDGALKFLAWDNVLASSDGFWTRASDYSMYEDPQGRFHIIPYDVNETFSGGGGPGGPGGPGGFGGRGGGGVRSRGAASDGEQDRPAGVGGLGGATGMGAGPDGPRGRGNFGPGMFLAPQWVRLGDKDADGKLSSAEFEAVADACFDLMDTEKTGKVGQEQCSEGLNKLFPLPEGADRRRGGGQVRFGPGLVVGPGLFTAVNVNKDERITRLELKESFVKWFKEWNVAHADNLDEEAIRNGLNSSLPQPEFGGPFGPQGGQRGAGGGGFPGGPGRGGTSLDPLVAAQDEGKPLISKLLSVPAWRARYLGYIRHMAENWLDWNNLGPIAKQHHALIADEMKADTRKLSSLEEFQSALEGDTTGRRMSLKTFADERRAFLLNHPDVKSATALKPKQPRNAP